MIAVRGAGMALRPGDESARRGGDGVASGAELGLGYRDCRQLCQERGKT